MRKCITAKSILKKFAIGVIVGVLTTLPLQGMAVASDTDGWLLPGDPELKVSDLPTDYVIPTSINYNTDCDTRSFDVVTREAKAITTPPFFQTELRHIADCAILTPRGMTDGVYLDAGMPAGRFAGHSGRLAMIPNSKRLMSLRTVINGVSQEAALYTAIVPQYNATTGEVQFNLIGHHFLKDANGTQVFLRPGSLGYSSDGRWMVTDSTIGLIRVNLETEAIQRFANGFSYTGGSNPSPHVAISPDGRYTAVATGSAFRIYDLADCTVAIPATCAHKDVAVFLASRFPGHSSSIYIRFASPDLLTLVADYIDSSGTRKKAAVRMAPPGSTIEDVNYLALGDSFSSGEGAYDYESGTDNLSPRNKCHLSQNSYPYKVAQSLTLTDGFYNVACSGALSKHFGAAQLGQFDAADADAVLSPWLPGHKAQKEYLLKAKPSVLTISMIGNDIGFSNKLRRCIEWTDSCFHFREDRESIAREIHEKFKGLVNLYNSIQEESPGVKLYVLGYPQLISTEGECGLNTPLDHEERQMAIGLTTYLNAVIKAATEKAGVHYIDVQNAFDGHRLCEPGAKAVNGLTAGQEELFNIGPIGNESFHPNAFGHELMAAAVLEQSQNFTHPMPGEDSSKSAPFTGSAAYNALIGSAPSGGIVTRAAYSTFEGLNFLTAGQQILPGQTEEILRPSSLVEAWLYSEPVQLGTLTVNEASELTGQVTIPETVPPGYHTLHLFGQNLAG